MFSAAVDVYERLVKKGKKAGFFQLLATQTVSAVWHVSNLFVLFMKNHFAFLQFIYKNKKKQMNKNNENFPVGNMMLYLSSGLGYI